MEKPLPVTDSINPFAAKDKSGAPTETSSVATNPTAVAKGAKGPPPPPPPRGRYGWTRVSTREWLRDFRHSIHNKPFRAVSALFGYYPDMVSGAVYSAYIAKHPVKDVRHSLGSYMDTDMSDMLVSTTELSSSSTISSTTTTSSSGDNNANAPPPVAPPPEEKKDGEGEKKKEGEGEKKKKKDKKPKKEKDTSDTASEASDTASDTSSAVGDKKKKPGKKAKAKAPEASATETASVTEASGTEGGKKKKKNYAFGSTYHH